MKSYNNKLRNNMRALNFIEKDITSVWLTDFL